MLHASSRHLESMRPLSLGPGCFLSLHYHRPILVPTRRRKGVNRVLGTLCAGLAALLLSHVNDRFSGAVAQVSTVLSVFLGGAIPMFYRFRPPFKDR